MADENGAAPQVYDIEVVDHGPVHAALKESAVVDELGRVHHMTPCGLDYAEGGIAITDQSALVTCEACKG